MTFKEQFCEEIEEAREEAYKEAYTEALEERSIENAKNLLKETDLPIEKIALCCSLPLEQVVEIAEKLKTSN